MKNSTWSSSPSRNSRARNSGGVARSNGTATSAARRACSAASRSAAGTSVRSSNGRSSATSSSTICAGLSPTMRMTVRSTSCRRTSSVSARSSAGRSSAPRSRWADGTLNTVRPSCSCSRYQTRCCISDSGAGPVSVRRGMRTGAAASVGAAAVSAAARRATVECSNTRRIGTARPSCLLRRAAICATRSEWPPSAKKSSWIDSRATASVSAKPRATRLLERRARRDLGAGRGDRRAAGRGQRLAVDLARAGQRQRRQRDEAGRDHVVGQRARQVRAQLLVAGHRVAGRRDQVRDQPRIAGLILPGDDGGLGDRRVAGQRDLDLAQLDAVAAQLDLEVGAAEALEHAAVGGGAPARQVAGAVQPRAGAGAEAIGHEALAGQLGAIEVAEGDAVAADVQLADHADRHRLLIGVEHVQRGVGDRVADQDRAVVGDAVDGRPHRGLGGAVEVPQRGHPRAQRLREVAVERLAAAQRAEPRPAAPAGGQQQPPGRGRRLHDRDRALDQRAQRVAVDGLLARRQHDRRADHQRQRAARAPRCRTTAW